MIGNQRVLALIPARGGSKGLPGKNIRPAGGKPLIAWTVEAARASRFIDRIVLSTDDDAIMNVARDWGCDVPFRRPAELATDTATSLDVALHALDALPGFDVLVLLQPTSPLRTSDDIDAVCRALSNADVDSCVSVCAVEYSPYWMYRLDDAHTLRPLLDDASASRRQDLPDVYRLNGAVYATRVGWLRSQRRFVGPGTVGHVMPDERSIDIDTIADFESFVRAVEPTAVTENV